MYKFLAKFMELMGNLRFQNCRVRRPRRTETQQLKTMLMGLIQNEMRNRKTPNGMFCVPSLRTSHFEFRIILYQGVKL